MFSPTQPAKTPKTATKLKLTTPKAPGTTEKKAKESAKTAKPKSERKKSRAAVSDEDVADEEAKGAEKELDPAEAKAKKEKEGKISVSCYFNCLQSLVLFLRHKLQKGFLSRDQTPQESEMATMANFITKLEDYGDLEVSIIRSTKINKVLKALIKLNTIPKDEEFNFKSRSVDLLGRWNKALGADSTADDNAGPSGVDKDEQPATNGVHKEDKDSSDEKKSGPAAASEAVQGTETLPDAPGEAKEAVIDTLLDGDATETAIAQEAKKSAEEVKADADASVSETS